MQMRSLVSSGEIRGNNRPDLSRKRNDELQRLSVLMAKCNARIINTSETTPQPYHFGVWTQTITVTVEGDYDDPKFKNFYDNYTMQQNSSGSGSSGGCYVATAVYGSYDCPQVWTLRRFRDNTLAVTWYGRVFIRVYYAISPTLVKWFGETEWFKKMWQGKLDRLVAKLQSEGIESTPYEDREW